MLPNQPQLDQNQAKPIDFVNNRQTTNVSQNNKTNLGDKLMDLTAASDESANKKRTVRGLTLSGIEESMAESSILHSLSETDLP